jgi:hypothetical protein
MLASLLTNVLVTKQEIGYLYRNVCDKKNYAFLKIVNVELNAELHSKG